MIVVADATCSQRTRPDRPSRNSQHLKPLYALPLRGTHLENSVPMHAKQQVMRLCEFEQHRKVAFSCQKIAIQDGDRRSHAHQADPEASALTMFLGDHDPYASATCIRAVRLSLSHATCASVARPIAD